MKIATFNINNVNKRLPNLLDWLRDARPDVACLQELKATDEAFPIAAIKAAGYGAVWHGQRSWNGVAILARGADPVETRRSLPGDPADAQSRYIEAAVNGVLIASIYLPNGNPQPGPKFDYKLAWFERLIVHAAGLLASGLPVVLAGDYNVIPTPADMYVSKSYDKNALLQPPTRAAFRRLLDQGWTDALRTLHPDEPIYTFWDYLRDRWQRNAGLRLDHLLLSPSIAPRLCEAGVDRDVRGRPGASDHAPTWIVLAPSRKRSATKTRKRDMPKLAIATLAAVCALTPLTHAAELATRDVPAKTVPVPGDVSPQIQAIIALPLRTNWNNPPTTPDGWKQLAATGAEALAKNVPGMLERLHVKVEAGVIDGVKVYTVTPDVIAPENRNRLLIHVHGGCYVLNPDQAALPEAIFMAGFGHYKVISVNYRMPPEAYYPAALDDAMTVWKAATKMADPHDMAIFGSSAGGALTLEMVLRAKADGLPLPAAIAPGTPMSDLTGVGDSFQTNAMVDNVLVSPTGFCDAAARFYAQGHDLADPMLSPLMGDFHGFPPAILTTGTRDLLLSNTVRAHRKLREAGVDAALQVFEGQSHAYYTRDDTAPESREAFEEIAAFFDKHLGK